jgi:predicted TPR repeat methyltransferase
MSLLDKFDGLAHGFSAREYAEPERYAARRAEVALRTGPTLPPGATVLDLACGDGLMAPPLLAQGLRYRGVDGSAAMIAEAQAQCSDGATFEVGLIDEYEPQEPVDLTLCLRAVYFLADRRPVFRRVASYTRVKFVFDFDPRAIGRAAVVSDLRECGFDRIAMRPFFLPQSAAPREPLRAALFALEHAGPLARAALHVRGIWFCAASSSAWSA